jgi:hypothetical protein
MSEYEEYDGKEEPEETTVLSVAERLGRRSFMRKLTLGAMGLVAALVGLPQKAEALVQFGCCFLCRNSTLNCSGACCWTWGCCNAADQNRFYRCKECYSAGAACDGSCNGVVCSQGMRTGFIC